MSDQYMKELLRVAVAQICQTIGYNATQTAPLELLQDVLDKFLREFTRDLRRQVEHCKCVCVCACGGCLCVGIFSGFFQFIKQILFCLCLFHV